MTARREGGHKSQMQGQFGPNPKEVLAEEWIAGMPATVGMRFQLAASGPRRGRTGTRRIWRGRAPPKRSQNRRLASSYRASCCSLQSRPCSRACQIHGEREWSARSALAMATICGRRASP